MLLPINVVPAGVTDQVEITGTLNWFDEESIVDCPEQNVWFPVIFADGKTVTVVVPIPPQCLELSK
jgi:hypothetical protein